MFDRIKRNLRHDEIVRRFLNGEPSTQIRREMNVSITWICKVVRSYGYTRLDGGQHLRAARKKELKLRGRLLRYNLNKVELIEVLKLQKQLLAQGVAQSRTPLGAYRLQRTNARKRNIEWKFTFGDWWRLWKNHFLLRGRFKNSLVMTRFNDVGPYSKDNVQIKTAAENLQEYRDKTRSRR